MTYEITLTGPEGANPLGFLCVLGTVRTLTNAWPEAEVKLAWRQMGAHWRPILRANHPDLNDKDALVKALYAELKKMDGHPAVAFKDANGDEWSSTQVPADEYRRYAEQATQEISYRHLSWMEFVAAFACESITESSNVQDTEFRFLGGGQQRFMVAVRNLVSYTQPAHLREAVFGPWRYEDSGDGNIAMRWDPADDRRHVLRWTDPTKATSKTIGGKEKSSKIWTVIGANRLAVEGLPFFPVFPVSSKLATTGFKGGRKNDTFWTWPLWNCFLNINTVSALLASSELQTDSPDRVKLAPRGIVEVYRTQKIVVGRYKNFTPAQPV